MHGVLDAIKSLEEIGTPTKAKPPTQFQRAPLTGLWHQHYLSSAFLVKNIELELKEMDEFRCPCPRGRDHGRRDADRSSEGQPVDFAAGTAYADDMEKVRAVVIEAVQHVPNRDATRDV